MVSAVTGKDGQTFVSIVGESSPAVKVSMLFPVVIYNYPSDYEYTSQVFVNVVAESRATAYDSQSFVVVVYRGRVENHMVRVWAFSLDGHDFYVITLGENTTFVYDLTTGQWSEWATTGYDVWRAHKGINWLGMGADTYGDSAAQSNVVAGDNNYGLLWTLNPEVGYDENPETGVAESFNRKVIGGVQQKMRETSPIGAAYLLCSAGSPQLTGSSFTLRSSDDGGKSWANHGTIDVTVGDYRQEYVWRSLGLIKQPGKLFEITDSGASVRIDSLDIR